MIKVSFPIYTLVFYQYDAIATVLQYRTAFYGVFLVRHGVRCRIVMMMTMNNTTTKKKPGAATAGKEKPAKLPVSHYLKVLADT
jgi:hypothetical protein